MVYRQHQQPGCGGCLLILLLFIFLTGGAPALLNILGAIIFSGLAGILLFVGAFWGFSYWVKKKIVGYESTQSESHNRFVWLLINILIHIAKHDGVISKEEIATIQRFFQVNLRYSQAQMYWVKDMIKEAVAGDQALDSLLMEFKGSFGYEPRLILLELIYQIIYTKTDVPESELRAAREVAAFLEVSAYDQRTIEAKYMYRQRQQASTAHNTADHYYAVLGLEPGADMATIKAAYRKLSMQYHPDKVSHLGEEFRGVAEEKMKEINAAYDYFKKRQ